MEIAPNSAYLRGIRTCPLEPSLLRSLRPPVHFSFSRIFGGKAGRFSTPLKVQPRFGAAVERRMISSGSNITVWASLSPVRRPKRSSAAFRPMASVG
jgi:hypothetical protein